MLKVICATWSELYAGLINEWIKSDFTLTSSPPHIFPKSRIFLKLSCFFAKSHTSFIHILGDNLNEEKLLI
jgi:hypothetical protein